MILVYIFCILKFTLKHMKLYINYILFLIFFSCNFVSNKKLVVEDLVANDLKTFDWNDVDTYLSLIHI